MPTEEARPALGGGGRLLLAPLAAGDSFCGYVRAGRNQETRRLPLEPGAEHLLCPDRSERAPLANFGTQTIASAARAPTRDRDRTSAEGTRSYGVWSGCVSARVTRRSAR